MELTREEKQLLLKDLCTRLPYGVYVDAYSWQKDTPKFLIECVPEYVGEEIVVKGLAGRHSIKEIKPYLRPMSSMTDEEKKEFDEVIKSCNNKVFACPEKERRYKFFDAEQEDFMNAHYFDYRIVPSTGKTMIESNLAIEAPEDMYIQTI